MNGNNQNLSIMKALDIIEYLAEKNNEPQRMCDIADALGLNISTVSRFLSSLVQRGYMRQEADSSRYLLSLRFCAIADRINANLQVYSLALPVMKEISRTLRETVCLAVEQNAMVEYIGVVPAAGQMMQTMQRIGNRAPMYCTGIGKLLLCAHSREDVRQILRQSGMEAFTPHTITDEEALFEELDRVRAQGVAYDNEECEIGARCIALPVFNQYRQIMAGLSVTGPIFRLTDEKIREFLPYLSDQVQRISSLLV